MFIMVYVTKIEMQKENHERFNIFVNRNGKEEFAFSVDQDVLIKYQLKKGAAIDDFAIEQILHDDNVKKAYNSALYFLTHRIRSEKEIINHLQKKAVSEPIIREVLHKLREHDYVNDREFANVYVLTQIKTTTKGPVVIRKELYEKGILPELADEALGQFTYDKQIEIAQKLYEKAKKQAKKYSTQQWRQYVGQLLRQKGFSTHIIQEVIASNNNAANEENEWEAIEYHGRRAHHRYKKYEGFMYEQKMKQFLYRKSFSSDMIEQFLQKLKEEQG